MSIIIIIAYKRSVNQKSSLSCYEEDEDEEENKEENLSRSRSILAFVSSIFLRKISNRLRFSKHARTSATRLRHRSWRSLSSQTSTNHSHKRAYSIIGWKRRRLEVSHSSKRLLRVDWRSLQTKNSSMLKRFGRTSSLVSSAVSKSRPKAQVPLFFA